MLYKLQDSTRNSIRGVSPISNRKVFLSYHQPSFLYGLDTMNINATDMSKLETKYRKVLKNMMSFPDCVSSPLVYLTMGVLPATAQRDIDVMGLLGQLAMCDDEKENVGIVIQHNLSFFDETFGGWSGLARNIAREYGLPDPLQYLQNPWRPDRWRAHCQQVIGNHWEKKLKEEQAPKSSSCYLDLDSLSVTTPMRIWQQAGLNSAAAKEAIVVSWMYLWSVFNTRISTQHQESEISSVCL